jgi:hypothetical protein
MKRPGGNPPCSVSYGEKEKENGESWLWVVGVGVGVYAGQRYAKLGTVIRGELLATVDPS